MDRELDAQSWRKASSRAIKQPTTIRGSATAQKSSKLSAAGIAKYKSRLNKFKNFGGGM